MRATSLFSTCIFYVLFLCYPKDNYYANYLTGAWILSFDPCIL